MQDENLASEDQDVDLTSNDFTHGDEDTAQAEEVDESAASELGEKSEESEDEQDEQTETPVEVSEQSDEDEEDDTTAKPSKGVEKRIGKLTFEKRQAQREADELRQKLEAYETVKQPDQPTATTPPTLEAAGYDETVYQTQMVDWLESKLDAKLERKEQASQASRAQDALKAKFTDFSTRSAEFAEKHDDYFEAIQQPDLPVSDAMRDMIFESDKGPEIIYHLSQNFDLADSISRMAPTKAAFEIGRLEARFVMPKTKTKKTTQAPPAVKKVVGSNGTARNDPDGQYGFIGGATFD
tara:strand:+ start:755 stop:1642 length:888 start_codon:yes stop_codon:yes gene_type:complete